MLALRSFGSGGHLCIVVGYHEGRDYWVIGDPQEGFRKYATPRLLRRWGLARNACFLVLSKGSAKDANLSVEMVDNLRGPKGVRQ